MSNPIRPIVNDELFSVLVELKLINQKVLRDFELKRQYKRLREQGMPAMDAILELQERNPHLQYDTIRKIIYSITLPEELSALNGKVDAA